MTSPLARISEKSIAGLLNMAVRSARRSTISRTAPSFVVLLQFGSSAYLTLGADGKWSEW